MAALLLALAGPGSSRGGEPVPGLVLDPAGRPTAGARVRIQASDGFIQSGADGRFLLEGLTGPARVTAALSGFRIGHAVVAPGEASATVRLKPLPAADNPAYVWDPPQTCVQCHVLLHQEWSNSPHAIAASDPMVLALYRGTNYDGTPSPGFGFRKAHPDTYGDCAFCHAPAFAARTGDPDDPLEPHHDLDRALAEGTPAEKSGVTCDFCHKVRAVEPSGEPPRPGRKLKLLRPPQFEPLMFGPFDDVTFVGMGAAYSPIHESSELCSLCHWDTNRHGVPVGSTYKEWLDGPYPALGKRCQDCHMQPTEAADVFCLWEPVVRNPKRIASHRFLGTDRAHLERSLTLEVAARRVPEAPGGEVEVEVKVTNSGSGHSVPTGVTLRHAILWVEARRASGFPLELAEGPRLPAWAGEGGPVESGFLAGRPGRGYAKITTDGARERVFDSEATAIVSDSRIPPLAADTSRYRFALGGYRGTVEVRARVLHRRWWKDLELERGFPDGQSPMAERAAVLPGGAAEFIRGDADGSGGLDLTDAVAALGHLYLGSPRTLVCPDAADADDSGTLEITDAIAVLAYLFTGGARPPEPFPLPGPDGTADGLDC